MSGFLSKKNLLLAAMSALLMSACSPGMFSDKPNESVAGVQGYRKINMSCSQLNLSSSLIDTTTFRKLIDCFNSEGALESVAQLLHDVPDAELGPVVQALNRYFLSSPEMLFQIESSFQALKAQGVMATTLSQSMAILKHPHFVQELIGFLTEAGTQDNFKLLGYLAPEMTAPHVSVALDAGLSVADSRAFQSFQRHLRGASSSGHDLLSLSRDAKAFFENRMQFGKVELMRELFRASLDGRLFRTWDDVIGNEPEKIAQNVSQQSLLMDVIFGKNAVLGGNITSLFHFLNGPLDCLSDSKEIPNANINVLREISLLPAAEVSNYVRRTNYLTILAVKPFCKFPPELALYYGSMIQLAETNAIEPAAVLLKSLYQNGLAESVIGFMADTGADDKQGTQILLPLLSELTERKAWPDLLLSVSLLRVQDRDAFSRLMQYWMGPAGRLGGRSPYDLASVSLKDVKPERIYHLLQAVDEFVESDEPVLVPLLKAMRTGFGINGYHPFIEMTRKFLADAVEHKELFESLAKISGRSAFPAALTLLAEMSNDGRFQDVLEASLKLFHQFSLKGESAPIPTSESAFVPLRAHNLAAVDLQEIQVRLGPASGGSADQDPCHRLSISARFEDEIPDFFACANQNGGYDSLAQAFGVLDREHAEDGRKYLNIPMDLINHWDMKTDQAGYLANMILRSSSDGSLDRLTSLFPLVVTRSVSGDGPALRPLVDVIKPVMEKTRENLRRILDFSADILARADLPLVMDYAEKLFDVKPEPSTLRALPTFDLKEIMHAVQIKEGELDSENQMKRTLELIDDYQNALSSWEQVDGRPRRAWKSEEIHAAVGPILKKFGDPSQSDPDKSVLDSALNVIKYFSLKPGEKVTQRGHYPADELGRWLHERAKDYRIISYIYSGESQPRTKLVSSLDRLEEVLVGADFKFVLPEDFALKFLQLIGESWGDEERSVWPTAIQERYSYPKKPPTLRKTYEKISQTLRNYEHLLGLPNFIIPAWVKAGLYNLHQTLPVIEENLPGSGTAQAGGLRLLRDLFWELHSSSPEDGLNPKAGWKNNLSVVTQMGRLGVIHQLSRQLLEFVNSADLGLLDRFSEAFVGTVNVPELKPILGQLFAQPDQKLLWKVFDQVFGLFDNSPADGARLKQEIFYFILNADQMKIIDPVLKAVEPILERHLDFLTDHAELLRDVIRSKEAAYFMRALDEDPDLDRKGTLGGFLRDLTSSPEIALDAMKILEIVNTQPESKKAIDSFRARMDEVQASGTYQRLEIGALGKDMFHFFSRDQSDVQKQTAETVRRFFAARVHSKRGELGQSGKPGEMEEFLDLAARKPDEFYQIFSGLSDLTQSPSFTDFVKLVQRSLPSGH